MNWLLGMLRRCGVGLLLALALAGCGSQGQQSAGSAVAPTAVAPSASLLETPVAPSPASAPPQPATAPASSAAGPTPALPPCANAAQSIARPPEFPANFPMPPGTVITARENRSDGRIIITTVVPALDVKGVAQFFEQALPKAGFTTTEGESEPGDAEANFEGNGYKGRWAVSNIAGCPAATTLTVLVGH